MKTKIRVVVLVMVLSLILVGVALADNSFEMPRWVLSSGASESASSIVRLNATLGQPFVGLISGGNITLEQGFWHGSSPSIYLPLVQK